MGWQLLLLSHSNRIEPSEIHIPIPHQSGHYTQIFQISQHPMAPYQQKGARLHICIWLLQFFVVTAKSIEPNSLCLITRQEMHKTSRQARHLKEACHLVDRTLCTSLHGSLQHVTFVYQDGCSYLPRLSTFISKFKNNFSLFHTPMSVRHNLRWWRNVLSKPPYPCILTVWQTIDLDIWVDTSTSWGIGIVMGESWAVWHLNPSWKAEGHDIGWAQSIALELVVLLVLNTGVHNAIVIIRGDNTGVIGNFSLLVTPRVSHYLVIGAFNKGRSLLGNWSPGRKIMYYALWKDLCTICIIY